MQSYNLEEQQFVLNEKNQLIFKNGVVSNVTIFIGTILIYYILKNDVALIVQWVMTMVGVILVRLWMIWRYLARDKNLPVSNQFLQEYTFGTALAGVVWAWLVFMCINNSSMQIVYFGVLVQSIILGIGAPILYPRLTALHLYLIPSVFTTTTLLFVKEANTTLIAIAIIVYASVIFRAGKVMHQTMMSSLNDHIILNREIKQHHETQEKLERHQSHLEEVVAQRTEEYRREKIEAENANQAKSQFLSQMSHELRTPLNAILGFAQILQLELENSDHQATDEYTSGIIDGGNHLLMLINDLLDLSVIESGNLEIQIEPVNLSEIIGNTIRTIRAIANKRQISINSEGFEQRFVLADRTRLFQILLNLLSNAVKYNKNKGSINITCGAIEDNYLKISVRDTGIGIDSKIQYQVFQTFNRLGNENGKVEGAGIGLSITKSLVEMMNGSIGFESEFDKGSHFWIELPIV